MIQDRSLPIAAVAVAGDAALAIGLAVLCTALSNWVAIQASNHRFIGATLFVTEFEASAQEEIRIIAGIPTDALLLVRWERFDLPIESALVQAPRNIIETVASQSSRTYGTLMLTVEAGDYTRQFAQDTWVEMPLSPIIALSVFVPTLVYCAFLIILQSLKLLLDFCGHAGLHLLEAMTEPSADEFSPATLLGVTLSALVAVTKAVTAIL